MLPFEPPKMPWWAVSMLALVIAVLFAVINPLIERGAFDHFWKHELVDTICHQEKKPSITLPPDELALLTDGSEAMLILV